MTNQIHRALALLLLPLLGVTIAHASVVDRIAATVDDDPIALSEVYELGGDFIVARCKGEPACTREMELEVLDALVKRALIRKELDRLQLRVTGEEIDQAIERITRDSGFDDRQALRAQLEAEGTRWDTFREEIADRLRTQRFQQRVVGPRVVIHDDEIKDRYQRTVRKGQAPEAQLSAMGILIPEGADPELQARMVRETEKLVAAINAGEEDWDAAVAAYDGAGLADIVGGRTYRQGQLTGALDALAFEAEVGVVNAPVRVGNVLFIIRVDERGMGASAVKTFEEMREQLKNEIFQEKIVQVEEEWYQRTRRQSVVDILLSNA